MIKFRPEALAVLVVVTQKLNEMAFDGDDELTCQVLNAVRGNDTGSDVPESEEEREALQSARQLCETIAQTLDLLFTNEPEPTLPEQLVRRAAQLYGIDNKDLRRCIDATMNTLESYG